MLSKIQNFRETKLSKEHDIAVNRMADWKKKFQEKLTETQKQVTEFKTKDRMSEADAYVHLLEEITKRLEDFNMEVRHLYILTVVYTMELIPVSSYTLHMITLPQSPC